MIETHTIVYDRILTALNEGKEHIFLDGGTASSKTFSVMQALTLLATTKQRLRILVVSESLSHLKRGVIRDMNLILGERYNGAHWNNTVRTYHFPETGSEIVFKPANNCSDRPDYSFVNEANNVSYEIYDQIQKQTRFSTICDWNPVRKFWYHDYDLGKQEGSITFHSTYRDNTQNIPESFKQELEAFKSKDKHWWQVYGEGFLPVVDD